MIDKKNKKGFGAYEMLTVCVMLLIIVVVALSYVFKTDYNEKYKVMQYNARMFGLSVANLALSNEIKEVYYLDELIDESIYSEIKNPFQGPKYCDTTESKVEVLNNKKYVTLRCGNYLISKEDFLLKKYKIYQVSDWSIKKRKQDNQSREFYNYIDKKQEVFTSYLEKDCFLYEYNKKNGTTYEAIEEIPKDVTIKQKKMYRHRQVVHE